MWSGKNNIWSNLTWQRVGYIAPVSFKDFNYLCSFFRKSCSTRNFLWSKPTFYHYFVEDAVRCMDESFDERGIVFFTIFLSHSKTDFFLFVCFTFLRAYYPHFPFLATVIILNNKRRKKPNLCNKAGNGGNREVIKRYGTHNISYTENRPLVSRIKGCMASRSG